MDDKTVSLAKPALYLVGTPIGNLEDITVRALRVLKEVDVIACEDTRQTQKLLAHYGIRTRLLSCHEHNEVARSAELVKRMQQGESVALVSDAGMPGISDPGYRLVASAIENKLSVVPIPGPSAFLAALVASGFPTDSFSFHGFLPPKSAERQATLEQVRSWPGIAIFYEAPHRIIGTLEDVVAVLGGSRKIVLARELTKLHEEVVRGTAAEVADNVKKREVVKGEITLLIGKATLSDADSASARPLSICERVQQIMSEDLIDNKAALKKAAKERGISKSEAYREMQRGKRL